MKKLFPSLKDSKSIFSLIGLLLIVFIASLSLPNFRTVDNVITIFRQASTLVILATGLTAVLLTGGMDLSVGATAGLIGCVCAQLLKANVHILLVILAAILLGGAVGGFNGFLVSVVKLPPFIATYSTNWVVSGLSTIVMAGAVIYGLPEGFTRFGTGYLGFMPIITIIALLLIGFAYFLLQHTTYGRDIYAIGANIEASRYSGIAVRRVLIQGYVFCSIYAGIGGLLMTSRLNAADAAMGDAYGLQTVAAVVIGGTSMLGGEGGVGGTVIGAVLLTVILNIMNLLQVDSKAQPLAVGAVIIIMVLFDSYSRRKRDNSVK